ncbi:Ankyrin repeat-containing protein [Cedratvirus Zaza IHUMI]|uniref:Ankyrin repeat-containing protein n=1 Tax=Cedratvirus Zaza IHUMI TaxID=2126979 RepID=A0A2R8FFT3_9VIRU|nr:Ankyrin repeat-containing protein [Cedratvirus Zaza IHUMI]
MQVNDFMVKKRELDAHVEFLREQLLLVEDKRERERLYSVLDELLAEKMQIDDYLEEASLEQNRKAVSYIDTVKQSQPVTGVRGEKTSSSSGSSTSYQEEKRYEGNWGESMYKPEKVGSLGHQEKDYPVVRDVQITKICEIERGKVVKLCALNKHHELTCRWCIYYGKNKEGEYVFSGPDRTIKKMDASWSDSLFVCTDMEFLQEQLLLVENERERERLHSVLDELLVEKMQMDNCPETFIDTVNQTRPTHTSKKVGSLSVGHQEKDYPEIQNVQIGKLCEIEKGKVVRLCAPSWCPELAYRWCIYYGKNDESKYVFSEADRTIKKIDASWHDSLFLYMEKTKFWEDRVVALDGKKERTVPPSSLRDVLRKDRLSNIEAGSSVQLWDKDWWVYRGKKDKDHVFVNEKGKVRKMDLAFSQVEFYYKKEGGRTVDKEMISVPPSSSSSSLPLVDKLVNIEKGKIVSLVPSLYHPEIGNRWLNYYGRNKKGEYVLSEADTVVKRIDASWSDKDFYYMDKTGFWKDRTVIIKDEMEDEDKVDQGMNYVDKESGRVRRNWDWEVSSPQPEVTQKAKPGVVVARRDDPPSYFQEEFSKLLHEMSRAEQGLVSDKTIPKMFDGKQVRLYKTPPRFDSYKNWTAILDKQWEEEHMPFTEDKDMYRFLGRDEKGEAILEQVSSKKDKGKEKMDLCEDEETLRREEKSLALIGDVGKALRDKFASRGPMIATVGMKIPQADTPFTGSNTSYPLALLKDVKVGSQVRLIGPPRVSVENFWSTYLGVDEEGYPILQDEKKRHRINKDYLTKEWAYKAEKECGTVDMVIELREACSRGQVGKVRKLLQDKFMLDGTHLCMAVEGGNLEILKLLLAQGCAYNKHTLSDFCGRSTLEVYLWLKANGYELTKQVLISACKSGNSALLDYFWKN